MMVADELWKVYRLAIGVEHSAMDDGYVVYHAVEDMAHYLNPTAAVVFELCDGEHSLAVIAGYLQEAFGLADAPRKEVLDCIAELRKQRLIEECEASSSAA